MKKTSIYEFLFKNGKVVISRGIKTSKYDWFAQVFLTNDEKGNKRFISLNQNVFLTKRNAKNTTFELLDKYNLL